MAVHTRRRGPEDRSRINLSEHHEIDFWTSRFDCTEAELRDAVNRLGTCAHVVKSFLRNRAQYARERRATRSEGLARR